MLATSSVAAIPWEFKKEKDGIKVYTRDVPGSDYKEFKAVMLVNASLRKLVAMLLDVKTMSEWMYLTDSIVIVEQINPRESIRHVISDFPWPAKDRDIIIKTSLFQKNDLSVHMIIESISKHPMVASSSKMIRVKHLKSSVRYFPETNGKIRIEYTAHYDPAGVLPSQLYNLLLVSTPYKTFIAMKQWIKKDIYSENRLTFIQEATAQKKSL